MLSFSISRTVSRQPNIVSSYILVIGKLFSNFLNSGLTRFVEANQIIGQIAGLRSGFSTTYDLFALKTFILYLSKQKFLY